MLNAMGSSRSGPWIDRHGTFIRSVVTGAALLSLLGPWAFELINVPAEFACSEPFLRLGGDFCGIPVPGSQVLLTVVGVAVGLPRRLLVGGASSLEAFRSLWVFCASVLVLLPVLLALVSLLSARREAPKKLMAPLWALAVSITILYGLATPGGPLLQWGTFLYAIIGLVAIGLNSLPSFGRARD
jgi:hypothetical protein